MSPHRVDCCGCGRISSASAARVGERAGARRGPSKTGRGREHGRRSSRRPLAADAERATVDRGFRLTISTPGPTDGCYARALRRETACFWRYACVVLTTRVRRATSREVRGRPVHRATEIARKRDGRSVRDSVASKDTSGRPGSCQPPPLDCGYRSREVALRSMKMTRCGSLHKCRAYSSTLIETVRRCSPNAYS